MRALYLTVVVLLALQHTPDAAEVVTLDAAVEGVGAGGGEVEAIQEDEKVGTYSSGYSSGDATPMNMEEKPGETGVAAAMAENQAAEAASEEKAAYSSGQSEASQALASNDPAAIASNPDSMEPAFPEGAKRPFEDHIKANQHEWAKVGGWSDAKEAQIQVAKAQLAKADEYVEMKKKEKAKTEIGCPCEGEKYHLVCQDHAGRIAQYFHEESIAKAAEAKAAAKAANATAHASGPDSEAHHNSYATYKKMLAKYGKLGPNSVFTPAHEDQRKRAKKAFIAAEILEEKAMELAVPEFKKVKEEFPEVFTNGKCPCPDAWTVGDGAALAAKLKEDAITEAEELHRKVVKMKHDPTYWVDINGKETFARPEDAPANPDEEPEEPDEFDKMPTHTKDVTQLEIQKYI